MLHVTELTVEMVQYIKHEMSKYANPREEPRSIFFTRANVQAIVIPGTIKSIIEI